MHRREAARRKLAEAAPTAASHPEPERRFGSAELSAATSTGDRRQPATASRREEFSSAEQKGEKGEKTQAKKATEQRHLGLRIAA